MAVVNMEIILDRWLFRGKIPMALYLNHNKESAYSVHRPGIEVLLGKESGGFWGTDSVHCAMLHVPGMWLYQLRVGSLRDRGCRTSNALTMRLCDYRVTAIMA
jgi:hypothetical protein